MIIRCHTVKTLFLTPLSGWNVPFGAPTSASSSTPCVLPACRGEPMRPETDTPPQGGAWKATPRRESATVAEHLQGITEVKESTQTTDTIRGTAAITKIRSGMKTDRGDTGTNTTEIGDMGGRPATETKTDLMHKIRTLVHLLSQTCQVQRHDPYWHA